MTKKTLEYFKEKGIKHYYFRFVQNIYVWGKGFDISAPAINRFHEEVRDIILKAGFEVFEPEIFSACIEGRIGRSGEYIYCHPMDFSGHLSPKNFKKFNDVMQNYKSEFWKLEIVDCFELRDNDVYSLNSRIKKIQTKKT